MPENITMDVNWDRLPEVRKSIMKMGADISKRRELLKIFRRQAKPYIKALRSGGIIKDAKRAIIYSTDKSITYEPGNLRKSMKMWANKFDKKNKVYIHAGPQAKKAKGSGFYGHFLLPGVSSRIKNTTDWVTLAWNQAKSQIENGISRDLEKYIEKVAKANGFETKRQ